MEKLGCLFRVSSKIQDTDGSSLDVQRKMGERISKELGLKFIEFDEGVQSSFKTEINLRPKLVELLDEISKPNGIRKVWVLNTDRLGRNSQSWWSILKVFLDYGVEIYVGESSKPYDLNNSPDKLQIGILSLISQYDNELRRTRSVLGKRNSLRSGNTYLGSHPPFGYSGIDKKLVVQTTEEKYVKEIFKRYNEGKSVMDIKVYLDKQTDIKPRKSKLGWSLGTIQKMMRNTVYIGKQKWIWKEKLPSGEITIIDEIEIKTPKIVDEKIWKNVNHKMDLLVRKKVKKTPTNEILKGVLICEECGLSLNDRMRNNSKHYYGRCSEYSWKYNKDFLDENGKNYNKTNCKLKRSLEIDETDETVLDNITEILKKSSNIREQYKLKNLSPKWEDKENNRKRIDTINKKLRNKLSEMNSVEKEMVQVEFDMRMNSLSESVGRKLIDKFKSTIEIINEDISNLKRDSKLLSDSRGWVNWIDKMVKDIENIKTSTNDDKKGFIRRNVEKILVKYNPQKQKHNLKIKFRLPIVGDELVYNQNIEKDEKGFKKYELKKGNSIFSIDMNNKGNSYPYKLDEDKRKVLNDEVIKLKEQEFLSLSKICETLNKKGFKTPTGKLWDKPKLSSYYKFLKENIPKKV